MTRILMNTLIDKWIFDDRFDWQAAASFDPPIAQEYYSHLGGNSD